MKQVINIFRDARLLWLIIGFGISVRLIQYLSNRSLWADEAVLALNIVNRSYLELGQPLDYDQAGDLIIWYKSKKKKYWLRKSIIYFSSILSFGLFYLFFVRNLNNNQNLMDSWGDAFPSSPLDLIWFLDSFGKFFYKPLGFEGGLDGLAIFAFAIGCFSYFSRNKAILICLLSPLFMAFLAASLQGYPFRSRLVLFLIPFFIIIIAEGASYLLRSRRNRVTIILGIWLSVLLVIFPILDAGSILNQPKLKEEIKPVISYIKTHQQPEDILYIYQRGIYQFQYYAEKYGYRNGDYIIGVDDLDRYDGEELSDREWQRYKHDLDKLRGNKRVWLLFSHANRASENTAIKSYLDRIGQKVDFFAAPGSFVYLYDLSIR